MQRAKCTYWTEAINCVTPNYIQYPIEYQEKMGTEASFSVGHGTMRPPAPGEFELARLEVTVGFRNRVGEAARRAFAEAIFDWGAAAADRGAFDDGPVALSSPGVESCGARSRFLVDASRSGQDTLNWLALILLDFGEDVQAVTDVFFGSEPAYLDAMIGPARGEWVLVEFSGKRPSTTRRRSARASQLGYVPHDAIPHANLKSKKFKILKLNFYEWESFAVTIYFGRALSDEDRRQLAALVDSWTFLDSYGGFGGAGMHSADKVEFDEATDSASLQADMGDAEPKIALSVLIRALEGFESTGPPIDALVLGRSGWTQTG